MAAQRLPWFKLWPECLDHEKIASLNDAEFRTWVYVLAKASQQPIRWRFASAQHAATVTGRSVKLIKSLIERRLLDHLDDGLWVHDWKPWQERHPSDFPSATQHSSPDDDRANAPSTLPEHSHKKKRKRETGELDLEVENGKGPAKMVDVSRGLPYLIGYASATGRKQNQFTSDDRRAAEALASQERCPDELDEVVGWMAKSPYHGDSTKLRSVERNWGKWESEKATGCDCGGNVRNAAAQSQSANLDLTIWDNTGKRS